MAFGNDHLFEDVNWLWWGNAGKNDRCSGAIKALATLCKFYGLNYSV